MTTAIIIIHTMACILLILIVLLQTGKGADMGASFGGYPAMTFVTWVKADTLKSGNNILHTSSWYTGSNDGSLQLAISNGYIRTWLFDGEENFSIVDGPCFRATTMRAKKNPLLHLLKQACPRFSRIY